MDDLMQYPIQIAGLLFIIKVMWEYIKDLKNKTKEKPESKEALSENYKTAFYDMVRQVERIDGILSKEDTDGRKLCYTPASHDENFKALLSVLKENTRVLGDLKGVIERIENS